MSGFEKLVPSEADESRPCGTAGCGSVCGLDDNIGTHLAEQAEDTCAVWTNCYNNYYASYYLESDKAREWLENRSKDGVGAAKAYLILCSRSDDPSQAAVMAAELQSSVLPIWLQSSYVADNVHGQFIAGYLYWYGLACERDYGQAVSCYHKAANGNHPDAQYRLGLCFDNGWGVVQDRVQAVRWYAVSAEQGHAHAQCSMGNCYRSGDGVDVDRDRAIEWYRLSAAQGYKAAISALRVMNSSVS